MHIASDKADHNWMVAASFSIFGIQGEYWPQAKGVFQALDCLESCLSEAWYCLGLIKTILNLVLIRSNKYFYELCTCTIIYPCLLSWQTICITCLVCRTRHDTPAVICEGYFVWHYLHRRAGSQACGLQSEILQRTLEGTSHHLQSGWNLL